MSEHADLYVLAAAYDDVDSALADYEAVRELYRTVGSAHTFDAVVLAKDPGGTVRIVRVHEQPARHGAAVGLRWGLSVGVAAALYPALGIAVATGGGAGSEIGAIAGHAASGLSRADLRKFGEALDAGSAGLVVVYAFDMAPSVAVPIRAADRVVSKPSTMSGERLTAEIRAAQRAPGVPQPRPTGELVQPAIFLP